MSIDAGRVFGAALLLAGCAGGSGGAGSATGASVQTGFASSGSSVSEGAASAVAVRLTLAGSQTVLTAPLSVTVTDTGAGSATSGSDYAAFPDQVVTFPVGSVDGAQVTVPVTALADHSVEGGDETIRLALQSPSQGVLSGAAHTVTVTDADVATIHFQSAQSATVNEASGTQPVAVELTLDPGDSLDTAVSAQVFDAGTGTASSGIDYAAFASQIVSFPAGTPSGQSVAVGVVVQDDTLAECGGESVSLMLSGASAGALLGGSLHTLTITDDDGGSCDGTLGALVDGGNVFGGESFDLGTAAAGTQGASVTYELRNLGATPISIEPLQLSGDTGDFTVTAPKGALPSVPDVGLFPMAGDSGGAGSLRLDQAELAWLNARQHVVLHGVPLPGGGQTGVELERLPSPWLPGAQISIDGKRVDARGRVPEVSLWRGQALGLPDSKVFLAFSDHGSRGWIRLGSGGETEVALVASGPVSRAVWSAAEVPAAGLAPCAGALLPPGHPAPSLEVPAAPPTAPLTSGVSYAECRLAIETDYQMFQLFNDAQATIDYVTQLVAAVSDVYERDIETRVGIAYLGIHTNANDGWSTQDTGGTAIDLLNEFQSAWSGGFPAPADLAHFISGAPLGGGVAYLGTLCDPTWGFGVSGSLHGGIDWSTFNGSPSALNWDFVVVAHELGHNFGASHTHEYCPPLDQCAPPAYFGSCQSSQVCQLGTLMSYCHLCAGMANIDLEFHPYVAQVMRASVAQSCLGTSQLLPFGQAQFTLSFTPQSGPGAKSASVDLVHGATNLPSPLRITLTGNVP